MSHPVPQPVPYLSSDLEGACRYLAEIESRKPFKGQSLGGVLRIWEENDMVDLVSTK